MVAETQAIKAKLEEEATVVAFTERRSDQTDGLSVRLLIIIADELQSNLV